MVKAKVTITLDRSKADDARSLLGVGSTSEAIDVALGRLIRAERLRRDIAAYQRVPPTEDGLELTSLTIGPDLEDDTDWEALYPEDAD